jgi:glycerate kinase
VKVLLAPDKFKGSLSAAAVAEALRLGWETVAPKTQFVFAPIADGGEGFCTAMAQALGGKWIALNSLDALGREIECRYLWLPESKTAVIEMSEASGLWRLRPEERDPRRANTYGTGLLLRDAITRGASRILLGLGGSATTDGGIGMAAALGYRFLCGKTGRALEPLPLNLEDIASIDASGVPALPPIIAACDVQNPLLGPRGTAMVYAPQKGADSETVAALEKGLTHLSQVVLRDLQCNFCDTPGAGAAGGIGYGLLAFAKAAMEPGFELVATTVGLEARIAEVDVVITGEGRLDRQTLEGKGPAGVAKMARAAGKPVLAFAGSIDECPELLERFDAVVPIVDRPVSLEEAMSDAAPFIQRAAARTARWFQNPIFL